MSDDEEMVRSNESIPQKRHVSVLILYSTQAIQSQEVNYGDSLPHLLSGMISMWDKLGGAVVTLAKILHVVVPAC